MKLFFCLLPGFKRLFMNKKSVCLKLLTSKNVTVLSVINLVMSVHYIQGFNSRHVYVLTHYMTTQNDVQVILLCMMCMNLI